MIVIAICRLINGKLYLADNHHDYAHASDGSITFPVSFIGTTYTVQCERISKWRHHLRCCDSCDSEILSPT